MKRLASLVLLVPIALLFAVSCQKDANKNLMGPAPKGTAHIPNFVTVQSTSGASFTTDKDDYAPGETVNLSGAGWQANDVLDILLDETPRNHDPVSWTITVDENHGFTDASYVVQESDLGVTFTITATSRATGDVAQATFTDGAPVTSTSATTVAWVGHGTTDGVCNGDLTTDQDDLTPSAGQQGWLFILTSPYDPTAGSELSYTFDDGTASPPVVAGFFPGGGDGSYHYVVYTLIGAKLLSASATNGTLETKTFGDGHTATTETSNLNVSHCESGSTVVVAALLTATKTAPGTYDNT